MNVSNIFHAVLALLAQAAIGLPTGNWWVGAAFGGAFYLGREVAQHEAHQLRTSYSERASLFDGEGMPWYEGFKAWRWSTDAKLDLIFPAVAVTAVAIFQGYICQTS